MGQVKFSAMRDGDREDFQLLHARDAGYHRGTAKRVLDELSLQSDEGVDGGLSGYQVSRLEHALQTATRALRDGADDDWIVAGLLHDVGDRLAPQNHDSFAAEIVRPFVREEVSWVVEHHGVFQLYYFGHHIGLDREARQKYADHPCYQVCADFCERWDQCSFDPEYENESLEFFVPYVERVFARTAWDPNIIRAGEVIGLPQAMQVAS